MSSAGFLGTGDIAGYMARTIARQGYEVVVSRRNEAVSAELAETGLGIRVAENHDLVAEVDTVFLCLRAADWQAVCGALPWRDDQEVVCCMSGVRMADLEAICAPVEEISITMPIASMEYGKTPLPVLGDPTAMTRFFGAVNPILPIQDESLLLKYFAASTLVAGTLGLLGAGSAWMADQTGEADTYVGPLLAAFLSALYCDGGADLTEEAQRLGKPNTLSRKMLDGLQSTGAYDALPGLLDHITWSMEAKT